MLCCCRLVDLDGSDSYCHLFLDDCDCLCLSALAHSDSIQANIHIGNHNVNRSNTKTVSVLLQIGRAGRDGSESYCHLFLDDCDFLRLRALAHSDGIQASNALAFLEAVFEERQGFVAQPEAESEAEYGALAVARVSEECDMKEEVMETLLSYLEV